MVTKLLDEVAINTNAMGNVADQLSDYGVAGLLRSYVPLHSKIAWLNPFPYEQVRQAHPLGHLLDGPREGTVVVTSLLFTTQDFLQALRSHSLFSVRKNPKFQNVDEELRALVADLSRPSLRAKVCCWSQILMQWQRIDLEIQTGPQINLKRYYKPRL